MSEIIFRLQDDEQIQQNISDETVFLITAFLYVCISHHYFR